MTQSTATESKTEVRKSQQLWQRKAVEEIQTAARSESHFQGVKGQCGWEIWGVKIAVCSTLQEFLTETPCNKRQTNRRKTNTSSITYMAPVHMGNNSEMSRLQKGLKRSLCYLPSFLSFPLIVCGEGSSQQVSRRPFFPH